MIFNTSWVSLLFSVALITASVWGVSRFSWLKQKQYLSGICFGLITIATIFITGNVDIPVIVSSLFFGSLSGIVSGGIAALVRILVPVGDLTLVARLVSATATLGVALFSVVLRHLSFEEKRPPIVPAVIGGCYAEMVHLTVFVIFQVGDISDMFNELYIAGPYTFIETALAVFFSGIVFGELSGWRKNLLSSVTFSFLSFAVCACLVSITSIRTAIELTDTELTRALKSFEENIEDQIGFMLHCNATLLVQRIGSPKPLSDEEIRGLANDYDVDELNIKAADGHTLASNDPRVKRGKKFSRNDANARPYFDLIDGKSDFVQQRFRAGINNPDVIAKYIAVPFPKRDGFLQVGYTWDHLGRTFESYFFPSLNNISIKKTGYLLVADNDGRIVVPVHRHADAAGKHISEIGMPPERLIGRPGELFYEQVFSIWCRCVSFKTIGRWRIYAVLPLAEHFQFALSITLIVTLILFFIGFLFRMALTRFLRTQAKIDQMRAAEEKRREEDLELAHNIQTSELKADVPGTRFYRVHAIMHTAKEVGGDFYDYYELDENRLVITIADVSGKGIPAAIFMMKAKTSLKDAITHSDSLPDAIYSVNQKLCLQNQSLMFVTAWIGILDLRTGKLEYISAGHNPPIFQYANGQVGWIKGKRSLALGVSANAKYTSQTCQLSPNDRIVLYTDGVTEAMNPQKELYGEARLMALLSKENDRIIPAIRIDLMTFMDNEPQADDITILTLKYLGE